MKKFIQYRLQSNIPTILRFAPWLLLITVFLLFQYFLFLNAKAVKKEATTAIHITKDRGAAIIHSFEATLFVSRGFTDEEIHNLLSEQANRTDIHFIALIDKNGNIVNSNNMDIIGKNVLPLLNHSHNKHHAKILGETNGIILDINLENGKKMKTFLVEKELFLMPYFQEKREISHDKQHDFPDRRYNPLMRNDSNDNSHISSQQDSPQHQNRRDLQHLEIYGENIVCFDAENPQFFPHPTMWKPRRRFMEENPLYMFIAFDMKEIEKAQRQDNAIGQIHTIGSIFLIILSIFSFFILRAYQRSYRLAQQSKDYILSLMHALPLGIIAIDHKNIIHTINLEAEQLTGEKEKNVIGKNIFDLLPQLSLCDLSHLKNKTITLHAQTNQPISLEINTFPIVDTQNIAHKKNHGMGIILRDLREIQKLQEEVHRQERLASVGRLAAGIAHEIRNPLGTIKGIARLFEEKANAQEQSNDVRLASIMTQEITRVDKVISDLLELSKPNSITPKDINMHKLLEKAKNSVFALTANIEFTQHIEANCEYAFLDEDRMLQVLHNIFINAIQAMDNKGCIEITISRKFQIDTQALNSAPIDTSVQGSLLEIRVKDTGKGIAKENIKNLFTPYYTSKAQGTGLGLVMVQKIVQAHNGTVHLESELGKGTSVIITIAQ